MKKCLLLLLISFYSNASDSLKIKKEFLVLHKEIMIKPMEVERKADSLLKVCQKMNWQNGMAEATYYLAASQLYNFKNTEKIKKLFDVAEKLNSNPDLQIQILLAKSYSNILEGTYQEAFSLSIQAFTLANSIKANHHLYRIFINLGNVYTNLDNHEKALEYFEKAYLQTNNETSDEQKIVLFNNINIVLSKKMDSKKAGFYRDKMLKILDSNQEIKYKYGQMCYIGIAYNYILLRQLENAEYYLSLVENLQKGKDPNYIKAYYLTNLGYIQICKKKI